MTPSLLGAAATLAVLELDATSAGQFMASRPAVLGPVLGAAFGQPALGAGLGALWELFCLDRLPCGGYLPVNATVAAGSCLLLALGPDAVAPEAAIPGGAVASLAHVRLEAWLRKKRSTVAAACEARALRGHPPRLGSAAAAELVKQAAMTFLLFACVLAARPALAHWWPGAPEALQSGLRLGLSLAPWAGLAALLHALRKAR